MTLIKSISGIRGTIGGKTGDNLTPIDAVKFAAAYGTFIKQNNPKKEKIKIKIVCHLFFSILRQTSPFFLIKLFQSN